MYPTAVNASVYQNRSHSENHKKAPQKSGGLTWFVSYRLRVNARVDVRVAISLIRNDDKKAPQKSGGLTEYGEPTLSVS